MVDRRFPYPMTTLAAAIATALLPASAVADSCALVDGVNVCTVSGQSGQPLEFVFLEILVPPTEIDTSAELTISVDPSMSAGFEASTLGSAGYESHLTGGDTQGLKLANTGSIILHSSSPVALNGEFYGLYARQEGGPAVSSDDGDEGGNGGVAGQNLDQIVYLSNTGDINLDLRGSTVSSGYGAAVSAISKGGPGAATSEGGGGAGGQAVGATVKNTGNINVAMGGSGRFAGIQAVSQGGPGADDSHGDFNAGGGGGNVLVVNSGTLNLDWSWQGTAFGDAPALYGILAEAASGDGGESGEDGNGGDAGKGYAADMTARVVLEPGGSVTVTQSGAPPGAGAGVAARIVGGKGGGATSGHDHVAGGDGGHAGAIDSSREPAVRITNTDASVITSGDMLPALAILAAGGAGSGEFDNDYYHDERHGGSGGQAGDGAISVTATGSAMDLSTDGLQSPGIQAVLKGGTGAQGGQYNGGLLGVGFSNAGEGGLGGATGSLQVDLQGEPASPIRITTLKATSPGVYALLQGGDGGRGGGLNNNVGGARAGHGGSGGNTGTIEIELAATTISTQGANSYGIVAQSKGGIGAEGGKGNSTVTEGANGGAGGSTGHINVSLDASSSIATHGHRAGGILAQAVSGAGGKAGDVSSTLGGTAGDGGAGGNSGNVSVSHAGAITTQGESARGILAQSIAGAGGAGGDGWGVFYGGGGDGATSGVVGEVQVTHRGSIATAGGLSQGILSQSIGGAGGAGGNAGGVGVSLGGDADSGAFQSNANASRIYVQDGQITTQGRSSIGAIAQSVGGGGGDGGGSYGAVSIGASGGMGGRGELTFGEFTSSTVRTSGDNAHGVVAQSIGGGGGNAGNAEGVGLFASLAVGASGGEGGDGGSAVINAFDSDIVTTGSRAAGMVVQSIGGGGGSGGQATTLAISPGVAAGLSIGGSGGKGGDGSAVSSQISGGSIATAQDSQLVVGECTDSCLDGNLLPVDAFGVVVQSIGGGGGIGGTASAQAVAISMPVSGGGNQLGVAWANSVGGSGGEGGDGNYATFAANQGVQITTSGQGAHGVMIQSVGGGGGEGGDSSALAAVIGYGKTVPEDAASLSVTPSFSLGGSGNVGGNGGPVWTALGGVVNVSNNAPSFIADAPDTATSAITTYGDFTNAIHAQSIGGGGGNAGMGSSTTQAFGTGAGFSASINLGGHGGAGGNGGEVRVDALPTSTITTYGSNAMGILAQSIGGGGGTSQGGSINLAAREGKISSSLSVAVGRTGGSGGTGGQVAVNVDGAIRTSGADAVGVLAQSIGGGGGVGGSAGSDASADNPVMSALGRRADISRIKNLVQGNVNYGGSLNLSVGGQGGAGNTGGDVSVNLGTGSSIETSGDWAAGIIAESIGGGGGKGGVAAASGLGSLTRVQINANIAVGGSGGTGSHGGAVTGNLAGGTISTAGYGAAGIFLQSIGGGGGFGADGSDGSWGEISAGGSLGGSGARGGSGGTVEMSTSNNNRIATKGEAAFGVVLQSVGGSGGFAGAGSSYGIEPYVLSGQRTKVVAGDANQEAAGSGGAVNLNDTGGLQITTAGNNAMGVLAQSVGGGGGIVANAQSQLAAEGGVEVKLYTTQASNTTSDGAAVTVNLGSASAIQTSGTGAHGLVAQSVGGGGGLAGLPGTGARLALMPVSGEAAGQGSGGSVELRNAGHINVSGTGAVGILAQSISGGGGLKLAEDGNTVYAGSASRSGTSGAGVEVQSSGTVSATGTDAIGIFAQNVGGTGVRINISGAVTGGSGAGVGVWVDSTAAGTLNTSADGVIQALSHQAILANGASLSVVNEGTIIGSLELGGGTMDNLGTWDAGPEFDGNLNNSGLIKLGSPSAGIASDRWSHFPLTVVSGDFTQTLAGTLQLPADFTASREAPMLRIEGDATLAGRLNVLTLAALPDRELHILSVQGEKTGALQVQNSPVLQYATRRDGQDTYLTVVGASFDAKELQLAGNSLAVAQHLQQSWNQGGATPLARLYAALDHAARDGAQAYRSRVASLSPGVALAPAAQAQFGMTRFTRAMMSCPAHSGDGAATVEQSCFWGEITGRRTDQDGTGDTAGFSYDSVTYQIGGQRRIAGNWLLGGSVAYQNTRLRSDDRRTRGSGDSGYLGVVLKREAGPWTFSGALGGGYGSYDMSRRIDIPGIDGAASSGPDVYSVSALFRAARSFDHGNFYLKPYVDVNATYSRMKSYTENGSAAALHIESSDQFAVGVMPALEIGGRFELDNGMSLRPYAYAGLAFSSKDEWKAKARLANAPRAADSFTTVLPTDEVVGRLGLGLHLMNVGGAEISAQYEGEYASKGTSHAGGLRLRVPF